MKRFYLTFAEEKKKQQKITKQRWDSSILGTEVKRDDLKLMRKWERTRRSGSDKPWVLFSRSRWESRLKTACHTPPGSCSHTNSPETFEEHQSWGMTCIMGSRQCGKMVYFRAALRPGARRVHGLIQRRTERKCEWKQFESVTIVNA